MKHTQRAVRIFAILILIGCAAAGGYRFTADTRGATTSPILLELFTSEGCSSCPPADKLMEELDSSQPIPGAQIIALSEHVDYWDHEGWKDPYGSHSLSERQTDYAHALGLNTVYTPQIIVDGFRELKGSDSQGIVQVFEKATAEPKIPVRISAVHFESARATAHAHVEVDGVSAKRNADIYMAVALDHAESQVLNGENQGKHLTHVAVVQVLKKIGKLEKSKDFRQDAEIKLPSAADPKNVRVVAFVQESGPGKVIGAAMQKGTD